MILSYALDPEIINIEDSNLINDIKNLFQSVMIIDKYGKLDIVYTDKFLNLSKTKPLESRQLEPYLFPEKQNEYDDFVIQNKLKANCEYKNNFANYICELVKMDFYLDFVLTTEQNKLVIKKQLKSIKNIKYPKFITEKKYEEMIQSEKNEADNINDLIEENKNKKFSLPKDEDDITRLMIFSDYLEMCLREWPSTIFARRLNTSDMETSRKMINFQDQLSKDEKKIKAYAYGYSINEIVDSFIKEKRKAWRYQGISKREEIFLENAINFQEGDLFFNYLMTFSYFFQKYTMCLNKKHIVHNKKPSVKIVLPDKTKYISSYKIRMSDINAQREYKRKNKAHTMPFQWGKLFKELIEAYIDVKYIKTEIVPELKFEFQGKLSDSTKSSAATHMRYILTRQKAIDLRTSSIFTSTRKQKHKEWHDYASYEELLDGYERQYKKSELKIYNSRSKPHQQRNTELDDFFKFRSELKGGITATY